MHLVTYLRMKRIFLTHGAYHAGADKVNHGLLCMQSECSRGVEILSHGVSNHESRSSMHWPSSSGSRRQVREEVYYVPDYNMIIY
jgi:hypothetical protein